LRKSKGQVATEFLLYTVVFLFMAIAAFLVVNHIQRTEIPARENAIAKETGQDFSNVISLSVKAGQGFTYNYTFPRVLFLAASNAGLPYKVYFQPEESYNIIMEWPGSYGNFSRSYPIPVYEYDYEEDGQCIIRESVSGEEFYYLNSSGCSSLMLINDGQSLVLRGIPS
jgi:hypothetical protein